MQMLAFLIIRVAWLSPYLDLWDLGRNPAYPSEVGPYFTR